jgi:type I restriction enzyme M protein
VKANLVFFTPGKPTEKIWYYDLSALKIGKRTPLILEKFEEFFQLLPSRADSASSWTVDIAERKRQASEKSAPLKEEAEVLLQEAKQLREQLAMLTKANQQELGEYTEIEQEAKKLEKEARELKAQAKTIEDAVYDLKAVNPNVKDEEDKRTPEELLNFIKDKGREADEILDKLLSRTTSKVATLVGSTLNGKTL